MGAEGERVQSFGSLGNGLRDASPWYLWGPYLSERQWGTVRDDYSPNGEAWGYLPHERARSQAYRSVALTHPFLGDLELEAGPAPDGSDPTLLFCDNDTNTAKLYGQPGPAYPKDGINDHVISGAPTVNPELVGTKCAAWYRVPVEPGETIELRLRLRPAGEPADLQAGFEQVRARRKAEADEFYAELTPQAAAEDEANVMRQAFAGLLWSKQLYYYDVARWLDGDRGQSEPPASRHTGRNARWRTFNAFDIMSMPDKWEYPWFAAWDMAFHCVALAHPLRNLKAES